MRVIEMCLCLMIVVVTCCTFLLHLRVDVDQGVHQLRKSLDLHDPRIHAQTHRQPTMYVLTTGVRNFDTLPAFETRTVLGQKQTATVTPAFDEGYGPKKWPDGARRVADVHVTVWKEIAAECPGWCFVSEDDAIWPIGIPSELPSDGFVSFFREAVCGQATDTYSENYDRVVKAVIPGKCMPYGAVAYAITGEFAKMLLSNLPMSKPVDHFLWEQAVVQKKAYVSRRYVVQHKKGKSLRQNVDKHPPPTAANPDTTRPTHIGIAVAIPTHNRARTIISEPVAIPTYKADEHTLTPKYVVVMPSVKRNNDIYLKETLASLEVAKPSEITVILVNGHQPPEHHSYLNDWCASHESYKCIVPPPVPDSLMQKVIRQDKRNDTNHFLRWRTRETEHALFGLKAAASMQTDYIIWIQDDVIVDSHLFDKLKEGDIYCLNDGPDYCGAVGYLFSKKKVQNLIPKIEQNKMSMPIDWIIYDPFDPTLQPLQTIPLVHHIGVKSSKSRPKMSKTLEFKLSKSNILSMKATGFSTYQKVTLNSGITGLLKLNLCAWCAGMEEILAYKVDRLFHFNKVPVCSSRIFQKNDVQHMAVLFQKEPYTTYLKTHDFLEGLMVDFVDQHDRVGSGMFCYSPEACSQDKQCPFEVKSVTELVIYDYLIGNNDRIGNCFIYPGSKEPLRLDQGGSHLHSLEWKYPSAALHYPTVKRVYVRDIITKNKYNKYICLAKYTEYGKHILELSKSKIIGTLLTNTLVNIPSFHQSGTQAYTWLNNQAVQRAFNHELTSRVQKLATFWHSHCSPPQSSPPSVKQNNTSMQKNDGAKIAVAIPTYNRAGYVQLCATALNNTIPSNDVWIFDDHSTEYTVGDLQQWFATKNVRQSAVRLRPDKNARKILEWFVGTEYDWIVTLDSDLIVRPDWMSMFEKIIHKTPGVVSLYHSGNKNHRTIKCDEDLCEMKTLGNAGVAWSKVLAKRMLVDMTQSDGFDWGWTEWLRKQKIPQYAAKNSLVLHVGMHGTWGADSAREKSVGFTMDKLSPYVREKAGMFLKGTF